MDMGREYVLELVGFLCLGHWNGRLEFVNAL